MCYIGYGVRDGLGQKTRRLLMRKPAVLFISIAIQADADHQICEVYDRQHADLKVCASPAKLRLRSGRHEASPDGYNGNDSWCSNLAKRRPRLWACGFGTLP